MKSYNGLYDRLCSFENLHLAFMKAARRKSRRLACAEFAYDRERRLFEIQEELKTGSYRHGPYRRFEVQDPKRRLISAAAFKDRVVHHALCNVIEPVFEAGFIYDTFACRKGKGTLAALGRCRRFVGRFEGGYVLKADISKFFHSVDHEVLQGLLARRIADKRILTLISEILGSYEDHRFRAYFPDDELFALARPSGIPIGNLTSQLFANVYLGELDRFVKQELRWPAYLRYMDDFLLFAEEKSVLHAALERIEAFLAERLRLRVHPVKRSVFPVRCGVDWVGYRVFSETVRLRRCNIFRFRARNRQLRGLYRRREISLDRIRSSIASFCGYARWADSRRLMDRLLELEAF